MIKNLLYSFCVGLLAISGLLGIFGCQHTPENRLEMPPEPPEQKIQSTPADPESDSTPVEAGPTPAQPSETKYPSMEGITLILNEKNVDIEEIAPQPEAGLDTVTVRVDPATPYKQVVSVMEFIHHLGYLIIFQSDN
jgi:hypothetical protein